VDSEKRERNRQSNIQITIPSIGYLGYFVRTPTGFILLIVIPASLIITMEIGNIVKEVTKTKEGR
jgi:hypothetical protein